MNIVLQNQMHFATAAVVFLEYSNATTAEESECGRCLCTYVVQLVMGIVRVGAKRVRWRERDGNLIYYY